MSKWTTYLVIGAVTAIVAGAFVWLSRHPVRAEDSTAYSAFALVGEPAQIPAQTATTPTKSFVADDAAAVPSNGAAAYSEFLARLDKNEVHAVTIEGHSITGDWADGKRFRTYAPDDPIMIRRIMAHRVSLRAAPGRDGMSLSDIAIAWLPLLLLGGASLFVLRGTQSDDGHQIEFGRSRARLVSGLGRRITFADVAGIDEARGELSELVECLKHPEKFRAVGGRIPKGCLLVGPPGTGKTLLARAIAGEANVPFFSVSGSDFVEIYVGVGASRVRDMFAEARRRAPCIIFIDEIDAVGRHRGAGLGSGSDEREQTLNQLLVELDGFDNNQGIIVIAATNRPDVLDPALLRPGRFDRQVVVPNPDVAGRKQILDVHLRKVPLAADVDPQAIARSTSGFSGAELANLVNEAALLAAHRGRVVVGMTELEAAMDKVLLGPERRSAAMNAEDKERAAYHEAGHVLVALQVPGNDPLHKVSIVSHGKAFGITRSLPERDRHWLSRREAEARIATMFGGRLAEELVYGTEEVTSGAANDIARATALARRMVTTFGFSEPLGPLNFANEEDTASHGHAIAQQRVVSDATAAVIDQEVRRIVAQGEATARRVLVLDFDALHRLARALLERETLSGDEIQTVLRGGRSDVGASEARSVTPL